MEMAVGFCGRRKRNQSRGKRHKDRIVRVEAKRQIDKEREEETGRQRETDR